MPVPKKRTSSSKRDMRRSHHALTPVTVSGCPNCGGAVRRHRVCPTCGQYKGRQVAKVVATEAGNS